MRRTLLLGLPTVLLASCSSKKEQPAVPAPPVTDTLARIDAAVVGAAPPAVTADAGSVDDGSKPGPPPPAFAEVARLRIEVDQGGPSARHCNGRVFEVALDLERGTWKRGMCQGKTPGEPGEHDAPLTVTSGKVDQDSRARIAEAYALLTPIPSHGGKDGGPVRLFVTRRDPASKREEPERKWIDLNWRSESPPPPALAELRAFAALLASIPHAP